MEKKWGSAAAVKDQEPSGTILELRDGSLSINAGGTKNSVVCGSLDFQRDNFFTGGYDISTDVQIGDDKKGAALYQSARIGDFSYKFPKLQPGEYLLDLHFAEIVFTNGPSGMRIFDVFVQEEKASVSTDTAC